MTISVTPTVARGAGNGVTTVFNFPFKIFEASDLIVRDIVDATSVSTDLTIDQDYSVSISATGEGGSVTLVSPIPSGHTLDIRSSIPLLQPADIINQGRFLPEVHEGVFDRVERQIQDSRRLLSLCFRLPDNEVASVDWDTLFDVTSRKGKYIGYFNATTGAPELFVSIGSTTLSQSIIGSLLLPRTAAEIAAGVTPVSYFYAPGHLYRYGTNTTPGTTDMSTAWSAALAQCQQSGGAPVYIPSSTHKILSAPSALTAPVSIYGDKYGSSILTTTNDITLLSSVLASSGSVIKDVKFVGKGAGATVPGLLFTDSNNNTLERVGAQSFGIGVRLLGGGSGNNSSFSNTLRNCRIISNISINIDGQANTNALLLDGTTFGGAPCATGLKLVDSNTLKIDGGDVEGMTLCALDLDATSTLDAGHVIDGLHIEGNTSSVGDIRIGNTATVNGVHIVAQFGPGAGAVAGINAVNCNGLFCRYSLGSGYSSVPFLMKTNLTNEDIAPLGPTSNGLNYRQNSAKFNYADQATLSFAAATSFDANYLDSAHYNQYQIRSGSVAASGHYYGGLDVIQMTNAGAAGAGAKLYARAMIAANLAGGTTKVGSAYCNGDIDMVNGALSLGQSSSAPVITNGSTITTLNTSVARVNPGGAVTGIIMQAGTQPGQKCVVVNESAFSVTMAAAGTSNVADGTSSVIAANKCAAFYWDTSTSRWYNAS